MKTVMNSILVVLKLRDILISLMVAAITFGTFLALNTLLVSRLLSNIELDAVQLGVATAILCIGLSTVAPSTDRISKLFKNRKYVISVFALLQSISIIFLLYNHLTAHMIYFCMLMFGFATWEHMLNFTVVVIL
ncbi:MAG: hypothetical protein PV340_04480 [Wolbachia sp.]|nr:hypothetical protein [Wolbachia sp.]MDD9336643.1 hypothetical protein [Wolbachia sp.]